VVRDYATLYGMAKAALDHIARGECSTPINYARATLKELREVWSLSYPCPGCGRAVLPGPPPRTSDFCDVCEAENLRDDAADDALERERDRRAEEG
jgi:hypothetical protein